MSNKCYRLSLLYQSPYGPVYMNSKSYIECRTQFTSTKLKTMNEAINAINWKLQCDCIAMCRGSRATNGPVEGRMEHLPLLLAMLPSKSHATGTEYRKTFDNGYTVCVFHSSAGYAIHVELNGEPANNTDFGEPRNVEKLFHANIALAEISSMTKSGAKVPSQEPRWWDR